MGEEEFYVSLIKFIAEALLDRTASKSEALKIITIGVHSALNSHQKEGKQ
jgi:hypothetical protein